LIVEVVGKCKMIKKIINYDLFKKYNKKINKYIKNKKEKKI